MSATQVSISSNACLLLGAQPINAVEESSDRARLAASLYPTIRDATLRAFPWNCCLKRVALAPDAETPAFDWAYQFTLPSDFLKAIAVGEMGAEVEFRIEGRKLLSDTNPCYLLYVFLNDNPGTWDPGLVHVVTTAMAAAMAYPITQSAALQQTMEQKAAVVMKQAKAVDGQDDTPETLGDFRLLASRFGSNAGR